LEGEERKRRTISRTWTRSNISPSDSTLCTDEPALGGRFLLLNSPPLSSDSITGRRNLAGSDSLGSWEQRCCMTTPVKISEHVLLNVQASLSPRTTLQSWTQSTRIASASLHTCSSDISTAATNPRCSRQLLLQCYLRFLHRKWGMLGRTTPLPAKPRGGECSAKNFSPDTTTIPHPFLSPGALRGGTHGDGVFSK